MIIIDTELLTAKIVYNTLRDLGINSLKDFEVSIVLSSDTELDGYMYADEEEIHVVVNPDKGHVLLTLAHELVHVHQYISNKPMCEDEAYSKESTVLVSLNNWAEDAAYPSL